MTTIEAPKTTPKEVTTADVQWQVWLTKARLWSFRNLVAVELHQRIAFGVSLWRWYGAVFIGPVVVVIGKRQLTHLDNLTEQEVQILDIFRDLEGDWQAAERSRETA